MKVVCLNRTKPKQTTKDIKTRSPQLVKKPSEEKIKIEPFKKHKFVLPEIDPVLTDVIDYKSPLLISKDNQNEIHTERKTVTVTRHVTFHPTPTDIQRPKTTMEFSNRGLGISSRELRKRREERKLQEPIILDPRTPHQLAVIKPFGKRTNYKSNLHEKVESIYYLRSKNVSTPLTEMKASQNLSITRKVPNLLVEKDKQAGICFT